MNYETEWTPGPWCYEWNGYFYDIRPVGCPYDLASVNSQCDDAFGEGVEKYVARLIATAPLMHLSLANRSLLCDDDFESIVTAIEESDSEKLRDMWERVQAKARKV